LLFLLCHLCCFSFVFFFFVPPQQAASVEPKPMVQFEDGASGVSLLVTEGHDMLVQEPCTGDDTDSNATKAPATMMRVERAPSGEWAIR